MATVVAKKKRNTKSFKKKYDALKKVEKQPLRGNPRKRCSENMQQIYRRTPMTKCNFIEIVLRYGCSPVNLLHIFRIPFLKNTSERLLLKVEEWSSKSRCYKIWHSKKYAVNLDQKKKEKFCETMKTQGRNQNVEDLKTWMISFLNSS